VTIAAAEKHWLWVYTVGVLLLTSVPYIWGFGQEGEAWRFTGFVFGVEDGNTYIAKMLGGASGAWTYLTAYTSYPQDGIFANMLYVVTGKLTAPPEQHTQLVGLFHLWRALAGLLMIWSTYLFIAYFTQEINYRRWGTMMATLGGGLGSILLLVGGERLSGGLPLELYSPETFGFLSLYGIPHLALARAGLLVSLLIFLDGLSSDWSWKRCLLLGLVWLGVTVAQPLTGVILGWVLGLFLLFSGLKLWRFKRRWAGLDWSVWRRLFGLVSLAFVFSGPLILYTMLAFRQDPFSLAWMVQNLILSPPPLQYLLAYGLMIPLVILGIRKRQGVAIWLLILWVVSLPLLVYAPVNVQRRMAEGVWPAMIAISVFGLNTLRSIRWQKWIFVFLYTGLGLCLIGTVILLAGGLQAARVQEKPVFRPAAEVAAFEFLAEYTEVGDVVLASYETGNALPAWAAVRVVVGHGPESVNLAVLLPQVNALLAGTMGDAERATFLEQHQVKYLFWGPAERALGDWEPGYTKIYNEDGYSIFVID
jgi:hypothetical protein